VSDVPYPPGISYDGASNISTIESNFVNKILVRLFLGKSLELLEKIYVASESVHFTFAIHVPIYGEDKSDDSVSSKAVLDAVENQPSR
jgi:hypothetical protein